MTMCDALHDGAKKGCVKTTRVRRRRAGSRTLSGFRNAPSTWSARETLRWSPCHCPPCDGSVDGEVDASRTTILRSQVWRHRPSSDYNLYPCGPDRSCFWLDQHGRRGCGGLTHVRGPGGAKAPSRKRTSRGRGEDTHNPILPVSVTPWWEDAIVDELERGVC